MSHSRLPPTHVIERNNPSPPPLKFSPDNGQITHPPSLHTRTERIPCAEYRVFMKNDHFKSLSLNELQNKLNLRNKKLPNKCDQNKMKKSTIKNYKT